MSGSDTRFLERPGGTLAQWRGGSPVWGLGWGQGVGLCARGCCGGRIGVFRARERRRDTNADALDQDTATPVDRVDDVSWFHQPGGTVRAR
jgi:hypothetical protein